MTKFKIKTPKDITIHQISHTTVDDLILRFSHPQNPYPFMWIAGILFIKIPYTETQSLIDQDIKGHIHWKILEFAKLDTYQKTITRTDGQFTSPIIDASVSDVLVDFSKWLKKQKIWEAHP